jgi:riboflavin synthase
VCLTATAIGRPFFDAEVSPETLKRSNLGALRIGSPVNLERPLSPSGRLGGHIVQGHIDGTGEFLSLEDLGSDNWWLKVQVPPEIERYVVFKGSVAIDGISLTVAALEDSELAATILPFTFRNTTLGRYKRGDRVNVECDILAKYVEKMLGVLPAKREKRSSLSLEKLQELGF